jgi:hypothetical protein
MSIYVLTSEYVPDESVIFFTHLLSQGLLRIASAGEASVGGPFQRAFHRIAAIFAAMCQPCDVMP